MKKNVLLMMCWLLVFCFGLPQTGLAANVPVYLEGENIGSAMQKGESYYVPLREMLARFDLEPRWSEDEGGVCLLVEMPDESVLHIYPYRSDCDQTDFSFSFPNGYGWSSSAGLKPFVHDDVMYVGLEALCWWLNWEWPDDDGSEVRLTYAKTVYEDEENADLYTLNLHNGELCKNGQLLSTLQLPWRKHLHEYGILSVNPTAGGNYLVYINNSYYLESKYYSDFYFYFVNAASGQNYMTRALSYRPQHTGAAFWPLEQAGKVYLNGNAGMWLLEDKKQAEAAAQYYDTVAMMEKVLGWRPERAYCCWTDGQRYLMLNECVNYVLYDMQVDQGVALNSLLLTDYAIEWANNYMRKAAPDIYKETVAINEFWQNLGKYNELPAWTSMPWLEFDYISEGVLYFNLSVVFYSSVVHNSSTQVLPLSISLEQIEELMS